ncbi:MAG: hypothetical protein EA384_08220 [Spirochaetaceae bacterium]|nr:MAG: hypothetical protein EA384_08220 [Spirochaetaceae bacterium]
MPLWVAYALILVGVVAILIETVVPAFGMIAALGGGGSIVAAIALTYARRGPVDGTIVLFSAMLIVPLALYTAFKLFPASPVGRLLINRSSQTADRGYTSYTEQDYADLMGAEGVTATDLRPVGVAIINGKKYSVVSASEYMNKDTRVRIIRVEGSRVVVRRVVEPAVGRTPDETRS